MEGVPQAAPKQNGLELLDCENTYPNLRRQIYGRCPASSTQTEWMELLDCENTYPNLRKQILEGVISQAV